MLRERWFDGRLRPAMTLDPDNSDLIGDVRVGSDDVGEENQPDPENDMYEALVKSAGDPGVEIAEIEIVEFDPEEKKRKIDTWKKWAKDHKKGVVISTGVGGVLTVLIAGTAGTLWYLKDRHGADVVDADEQFSEEVEQSSEDIE